MVVSMKTTAFWDIAPCHIVEVDWQSRGAYCLLYQDDDHPDDGGITYF
jgi:hypothetical protein